MSKKIQEYSNDEIVVTYDPNVCAHAAKCVAGMPSVFDPKGRPWINLKDANAAEVMRVIDTCPSKALGYRSANADPVEAASESESNATSIDLMKNGPARLHGNFVVKDSDGNVLETGDRIALCRCGHSKNKPFCDGSHKTQAWTEA